MQHKRAMDNGVSSMLNITRASFKPAVLDNQVGKDEESAKHGEQHNQGGRGQLQKQQGNVNSNTLT